MMDLSSIYGNLLNRQQFQQGQQGPMQPQGMQPPPQWNTPESQMMGGPPAEAPPGASEAAMREKYMGNRMRMDQMRGAMGAPPPGIGMPPGGDEQMQQNMQMQRRQQMQPSSGMRPPMGQGQMGPPPGMMPPGQQGMMQRPGMGLGSMRPPMMGGPRQMQGMNKGMQSPQEAPQMQMERSSQMRRQNQMQKPMGM